MTALLILTLNLALGMECPAYVTDAVELSDFMLKTAEEKVALRCLSADYDGNGSLDFTLTMERLADAKGTEFEAAVYLFNKKKLVSQHSIGRAAEVLNYDPAEQSPSCIRGKRVGIQLKNPKSVQVLVWNTKAKKFDQHKCP